MIDKSIKKSYDELTNFLKVNYRRISWDLKVN